jgi:hypothetical protein
VAIQFGQRLCIHLDASTPSARCWRWQWFSRDNLGRMVLCSLVPVVQGRVVTHGRSCTADAIRVSRENRGKFGQKNSVLSADRTSLAKEAWVSPVNRRYLKASAVSSVLAAKLPWACAKFRRWIRRNFRLPTNRQRVRLALVMTAARPGLRRCYSSSSAMRALAACARLSVSSALVASPTRSLATSTRSTTLIP